MSHQPYVPYISGGGSQQQQQQQQQNSGQNQQQPAGAASSVYAPLQQQQQYGVTSSPEPYRPISATAAPPATTSASSSYASSSASNKPSKTLPPFGQALNHPPPSQQQYSQQASQTSSSVVVQGTRVPSAQQYSGGVGGPSHVAAAPSYPQYSASGAATATAPPAASSFTTSANYDGLPTGGLVSEGNPKRCHKLDYEIKGTSTQLVEIQLDPGETVIAEAGAMMWLDNDVDFKAKFGDGSNPSQGFFGKLMAAGGRILTGESLFLTHFTNRSAGAPQRVAFAAPYPGTLLPINMQDIGETLICQKDAFVCAALGTKVSIHFNKRIGSGFFGGEGFILQKLEGDGMAFVHAGGTVMKRELRGERIRLDTGCLVAFTKGITYDITFVPGLKSIVFGGEGLFLATLAGTGTVWMQSLPFSRMADRIIKASGGNVGEGTPLNPLYGVTGGDGAGGNLGFSGF